jgi:uncharacterized membrane protein YfcA
MTLIEPSALLVVSIGVFAGAVVSGLVGFAFSAVAGAFLLHVMPPIEAVPLMMACSIVTQAVSLVALRGTVQWRGSLVLTGAGAIGIIPALYLLHQIEAQTFRMGFGAFLAVYAGYMLLRPAMTYIREAPGRLHDAVVGFGGGLLGGLTAMPGALPTLWCDLRGMPKDQQRGLVQPYITAMQLFALAMLISRNGLSTRVLLDLTMSLPALAAGAALGVVIFGRVDNAVFRHIVLLVLLAAGLILIV